MPHLSIEYSANLPQKKLQELCDALTDEIIAIALYPLGGIRVRALPCASYAIADRHDNNAFADMLFRIGAGRSVEDKKATGERLMKRAEQIFAAELAQPYFALSLEIIEIDPLLSWKTNSIHPRLKGKA